MAIWWFVKTESVTFYLQFPDTTPVNTTLLVDDSIIFELRNYTFSCVPAISYGETLTLTKGSHTLKVIDIRFSLNITKSFYIWGSIRGQSYVYVFVSQSGVSIHITDHQEALL